jgi:hypothetical protein
LGNYFLFDHAKELIRCPSFDQYSNSYCLSYTTGFNADEVTITFTSASPFFWSCDSFKFVSKSIFGVVSVVVIAAVVAVVLSLRRRKAKLETNASEEPRPSCIRKFNFD